MMYEYNEGEHAFWNGKPITDNPYSWDDTKFKSWRLGWQYGQWVSTLREEEVEGG